MKHNLGKLLFPALLIVAGLGFIIFGYTNEQNWQFKFAGFSVFITGVIFILNILELVQRTIRIGLFAILILSALGLTYLDYKSIKDPIDFRNEKKRRYTVVVQRLKDIRAAQLVHKTVKGKYAGDFESLLNFIKNDSLPVIKAIGTVPDTLTEEKALQMGLVQRDTTYVSAKDSIFSEFYLKERMPAFHVDSLPFIPFGSGEKFSTKASQVEKNKVNVQVVEVLADKKIILKGLDPVLISREEDLKFGSITDPNTNGNWGE